MYYSFSLQLIGLGNVVDQTPPVIVDCPNDKTAEVTGTFRFYFAEWSEPTATDDSGSEVKVTSNRHSPSYFNVPSENVITYTFTDAAGNTADCTFTYTITGTESHHYQPI